MFQIKKRWQKMNLLISLSICICWLLVFKLFKDNTCVLNNHKFKFNKNKYVCQKCGLIKIVVKK